MLHVAERKALYALFAQLFSYPDRQLAETLAAEETRVLTALLDGDLTAPTPSTEVDELQTAYTDLFINRLGGVPAPPYGSVYLEKEGRLMGETTRRVAAWYAEQGLRQEESGEPADFLSTELEFLYYLVEREEAALALRDPDLARAATLAQAQFGAELLFPWLGIFCRKVAGEGRAHPFYRQAAELLARFCRGEQEWLNRLHPES